MQSLSWGSMNPNSANQRWSRWTFGVQADPAKLPSFTECVENARRYFKRGFGSAGRARVTQPSAVDYVFEVEVEEPPAHDPAYRTHVKRQFIEHFMFKGFGYSARLVRFDVKLLAGSREDGTPADQLVVIPPLPIR